MLDKNLHTNTNDRDHLIGVTNDLDQKKTYLTETITTVREERDNLSKWKKEKEEEWKLAREEMLRKIAELEKELAGLKSSSQSSTSEFQDSNEKLRKKRDELLKENKKLEREIEELEKQFNRFNKKLQKEERARKELQKQFDRQKKDWDLGVSAIRKDLLQHISDMNIWKVFLEQNDDYAVDASKLHSEEDISTKGPAEQIVALDVALQEEIDRFRVLLDDKSKASNTIKAFTEDTSSTTPKDKKSKKKKRKDEGKK